MIVLKQTAKKQEESAGHESIKSPYYLIPISAKSKEALMQKIKDMSKWLVNHDMTQSLESIAYTICVGRSHFKYRVACIINSKQGLINWLKQLNSELSIEMIDQNSGRDMNKRVLKDTEELIQNLVSELLKISDKTTLTYKEQLEQLAEFYVQGYPIDFSHLYSDKTYKKISMPTYPFLRDRYWVEIRENQEKMQLTRLHALIDTNKSTIHKQIFSKKFDGEAFYLKDHVVGNNRVLPGVVYLEMGRVVGVLSDTNKVVTLLRNIEFLNPIKLANEEKTFDTEIIVGLENELLTYKVISQNKENEVIAHQVGKIGLREKTEVIQAEYIEMNEIKARCPNQISVDLCYNNMNERGLHLGESFQAIKHIQSNDKEVLAELELPKHLNDEFEQYLLHPTIMDGALEIVVNLVGNKGSLSLPCAIKQVEILAPLEKKCYSYAINSLEPEEEGFKKFDVCITNKEGKILIKIKGFTFKEMTTQVAKGQGSLLYFTNIWKERELSKHLEGVKANEMILYFGEEDSLYTQLNEKCKGQIVLIKKGTWYQKDKEHVFTMKEDSTDDCCNILRQLLEDNIGIVGAIYGWDKSLIFDVSADYEKFINPLLEVNKALVKMVPKAMRIYFYYELEKVSPYHEAVSGFMKSINLETGSVSGKVVRIHLQEDSRAAELLLEELIEEQPKEVDIQYVQGKRMVKGMNRVIFDYSDNMNPFKENGVYVITGGMGKLGILFAKEIASKVKTTLILTGRSTLGRKQQTIIEELKNTGSNVVYLQIDITVKEQVQEMFAYIKKTFNKVTGIIHNAGVIKDSMLDKKEISGANDVIAPKIYGTLYLDEVFRDEALDFFMMTSSIAAQTGNVGQCDYAYANHFMDSYAKYRESLVECNKRRGRTISINWPLWQDGSMMVSKEIETFFVNTIGSETLSKKQGLKAFNLALVQPFGQLLVIQGNEVKVERYLGISEQGNSDQTKTEINTVDLIAKTEQGIAQVITKMLKIKDKDIDMNKNVNDYGFNSMSIVELTNKINEKYDLSLTPAIYFQYGTIKELSEYLCDEYKTIIEKTYEQNSKEKQFVQLQPITVETYSIEPIKQVSSAITPSNLNDSVINTELRKHTISSPMDRKDDLRNEPIAIIGISGIMPQSEDMKEFWDNLENKRDLVCEIPEDRWNWRLINNALKDEWSQPISRWGGFMNEVDKFDAEFFGISPREARVMDPQQRLLLQTVWHTIEDAGYKAKDLWGTNTGVFVGVATMDYSDVLREYHIPIEAYSSTGASHCILANRISYLFNWHGPSEPIDTACSSSLVAIHRAVESIYNHDCDIAIAGGVNVISSPLLHLAFSKAGMLSPDGRCKTFDQAANGYVRGEGCGAILLKPLSKALEDGDNIYGLIKGTGINHGGKANSLTAPNPKAQADLIMKTYEKAGFSPDTVSYIEAHGTGTNLGDPVEIDGLKLAFKQMYAKSSVKMYRKNYCHVSSVKTNIGHLEAAAGIASILKVILSMKYKKIAGNVHFKVLNPYILIEDTPLDIVKDTIVWKRLSDKDGKIIPRRAGVSSFGFGGTNAHIALEEYIDDRENIAAEREQEQIIVLSAKRKSALKEAVGQLINYLESEESQTVHLGDIAYTLQVGREEMEERLAVVVTSKEMLLDELKEFMENKVCNIIEGSIENDSKKVVTDMDEEAYYVDRLLQEGELNKLARYFVMGGSIEWSILHKNKRLKRIPLPTYPFAKDKHWIQEGTPTFENGFLSSETNKNRQIISSVVSNETTQGLHPMIDVNESTLFQQVYRKRLKRSSFYLRDHVVNKMILLPGVAYLEILRAAAKLAGVQKEIIRFRDIVWLQPLIMLEEEKDLYISLSLENGRVNFTVYTYKDKVKVIHCESYTNLEETQEIEASHTFDLGSIKDRCSNLRDKSECYNGLYKRVGFDYGLTFQVTNWVVSNEYEVLAQLELSKNLDCVDDRFVLHPALLDGVIRSIACMGDQNHNITHVPFFLGELDILGKIPDKCYAYCRLVKETKENDTGTMKFDISALDENGKEVIRIKNFTARPYKSKDTSADKLVYIEDVFKDVPLNSIDKELASLEKKDVILIIENNEKMYNSLFKYCTLHHLEENIIRISSDIYFRCLHSNHYMMNLNIYEDYERLFRTLVEEGKNIKYIINIFNMKEDLNNTSTYDISTVLNDSIYQVMYAFNAIYYGKYADKIKYFFSFDTSDTDSSSILQSIGAFSHSMPAINHKFELVTIEFENEENVESRMMKLFEEVLLLVNHNGTYIKYESNRRKILTLGIVDEKKYINELTEFKQQGTYIITGGLGKLGYLFAKELAKNYKANLVLTGRRVIGEKQIGQIKQLQDLGAKVLYKQANVADKESIEYVLKDAKKQWGKINGVIHCAGIIGETPIHETTKEQFNEVLTPKVFGTLNIDQVTQNEDLDLFIMFSSISTEIGDLGACSYAIANGFMDKFARRRETLRLKGIRKGKTIAMAWSLWKDGAMDIPKEQSDMYSKYYGMKELEAERGIKAFYNAIKIGKPHLLITAGDEVKIKRALKVQMDAESISIEHIEEVKEIESITRGEEQEFERKLLKGTENYLRNVLSQASSIPPERIMPNANFEKYGIDSIMIMELNKRLEKDFDALDKTLFFEYNTLNELVKYFLKEQRYKLIQVLDLKDKVHEEDKEIPISLEGLHNFKQEIDVTMGKESTKQIAVTEEDDDIAIIGINGKYPMANNLDEFWNNLVDGKDCITEVPKERWNHSMYYSPKKDQANKVYSKWGGFIDDVDKFDPLFFQITPKDAEFIDPQEKLFLQDVYGTLEDAGYCGRKSKPSKVGVFVGVMYGHYQLYGLEETLKGNLTALSSSYASIANRVSYFFNFQGPSIALDTMCSSSLTAFHLACESIKRGECEMAIAGGVNVTIHLDKYIFLSTQRFASSEGKCRSFGDNGDGYVPGEGVGSVLLKPLKKAIADNDNIYAVVKGTYINHGGKTSGYSVSNPNAQAEVISETLKKANINPRTIGYIEAHGTGTALGDPIEIRGLVKAFEKYTKDKQYCRIGSVKSNIGHAEGAAGIASITKTVLQLKNKKIVPSLHSKVLNSNIQFENTPFIVQQTYEDWMPNTIIENGKLVEYPRRAGISCFGAGGANAHVILEEYVKGKKETNIQHEYTDKELIILSARTEERLKDYCAKMVKFLQKDNMVDLETLSEKVKLECLEIVANILGVEPSSISYDMEFEECGFDLVTLNILLNKINSSYSIALTTNELVENNTLVLLANYLVSNNRSFFEKCFNLIGLSQQGDTPNLADIAYSLQVGRYAVEGARFATIVSSLDELLDDLNSYTLSNRLNSRVKVVNLRQIKPAAKGQSYEVEDMEKLYKERNLEQLATLWCTGRDVEWEKLYENQRRAHVSLPKYPFERIRSWFTPSSVCNKVIGTNKSDVLHEMIDENISTFKNICYKKALSKNDFYIRDHVIQGKTLLPGVGYLEMACAGARLANDGKYVRKLKNVVWMKPIEIEEQPVPTFLAFTNYEEQTSYEIYTFNNNEKHICSKGKIEYEEVSASVVDTMDLNELKNRCTNHIKGDILYKNFQEVGLEYGEGLRAIQEASSSTNEILSKIALPKTLKNNFSKYTLHPSLLDAALQSIAAYTMINKLNEKSVLLPFSMGELEIVQPLEETCYVYITLKQGSSSQSGNIKKYNITILNETGKVLVKIKDFTGREFKAQGPMSSAAKKEEQQRDKKIELMELLRKLEDGEITLTKAEQLMEGIE